MNILGWQLSSVSAAADRIEARQEVLFVVHSPTCLPSPTSPHTSTCVPSPHTSAFAYVFAKTYESALLYHCAMSAESALVFLPMGRGRAIQGVGTPPLPRLSLLFLDLDLRPLCSYHLTPRHLHSENAPSFSAECPTNVRWANNQLHEMSVYLPARLL